MSRHNDVGIPPLASFHHGVEYDQQFAHTRGQGHLLWLASLKQALVKLSNHRIAPTTDQRPHIQRGAYSGSTSPHTAPAPTWSAVPVERSHTHQGGYPLAIQRSQLRQIRQQRQRYLLSYARNALQKVVFHTPQRTFAHPVAQVFVQVFQFVFQPGYVSPGCGDAPGKWPEKADSSQPPVCSSPVADAPAHCRARACLSQAERE